MPPRHQGNPALGARFGAVGNGHPPDYAMPCDQVKVAITVRKSRVVSVAEKQARAGDHELLRKTANGGGR
jgi:hypothetical protein